MINGSEMKTLIYNEKTCGNSEDLTYAQMCVRIAKEYARRLNNQNK